MLVLVWLTAASFRPATFPGVATKDVQYTLKASKRRVGTDNPPPAAERFINPTFEDLTLLAVQDLPLTTTTEKKDALLAKAIASGADDKKVEIELKRLTENATQVSVRVGVFRDEAASRVVLKKIRAKLGDGPAVAAGQ